MSSDYKAIKTDNERKYGTDIGRYGPKLLADRYDDRTHFIYELLQNAEDALARRDGWGGDRAIDFFLSPSQLRIRHYGKQFDEQDVRGICGIAESTKKKTDIGRFGIGFKSVYAFTDLPEIHSGEDDFVIDSFVWPCSAKKIDRKLDETIIILPLRPEDETAHDEILNGLRKLGPRTLLFLHQIEELKWHVEDGPSGFYLRSKPETVTANAYRINVIGQEDGKPEIEESYIVFYRDAKTTAGDVAGKIEIAFALIQDESTGKRVIKAIDNSPLVAFFPTVVQTNLGFLVQGPYRTTPSRDNIPQKDTWNQHLVKETGSLLVDALRSLRDLGMLGVNALRCLPLDRTKFGSGHMFTAMFDAVQKVLTKEPLLPRYGGGYISAKQAKLARSQELRTLLSPSQLGSIYGSNDELFWVSEEITQDRTPDLRQYLYQALGVSEVTPEVFIAKLNEPFLKAQDDDWIREFYEFMQGQPALLKHPNIKELPIVRLEDGQHVVSVVNNQPQAFLPGPVTTAFPTVRPGVCSTEGSRAFLAAIGLTTPDPVDDVIRNILPKYSKEEISVNNKEYESDINRILTAFSTDSKRQKEKLISGLQESTFVLVVDAGDGSGSAAKPRDCYIATERLSELFSGVRGVLLVDRSIPCLRGEAVRDLLIACGADRYLQPISQPSQFTYSELAEMRKQTGYPGSTGRDNVEDVTLRGLDDLLLSLRSLDKMQVMKKARLLWECLIDLPGQGTSYFQGIYRWFYYDKRSCRFEAAFVRQLNDTEWIPAPDGKLKRPAEILFDSLGWEANPFLLSKIHFKPPILDVLAKEAGIEPGILELLKKLGVTTEDELKSKLGYKEKPDQPSANPEPPNKSGQPGGQTTEKPHPTGTTGPGSSGGGDAGGGNADTKKRPPRIPGTAIYRPFISYIGTHPDEKEDDPDGLSHEKRMDLEAKAIQFIRSLEPNLLTTPPSNEGYDLYEIDPSGAPIRWIEVKAMTGSLDGRPVGMSHTQFAYAQEHRDNYWLYIVENATLPESSRIVKIQDPAGKSSSFTFDHGWRCVAELDPTQNVVESEEE